jgi:hypothetical protein
LDSTTASNDGPKKATRSSPTDQSELNGRRGVHGALAAGGAGLDQELVNRWG